MTTLPETTVLSPDYSLILIAHMICADGQIHNEETSFLTELTEAAGANARTREEVDRILAQEDGHISVSDALMAIAPAHRDETLRQLLAMAYADGYLSPHERQLAVRATKEWGYPEGHLQELIAEAEFRASEECAQEIEEARLSPGALLLKGMDTVISRKLVDKLSSLMPDEMGKKVQKLRKELLLAGPDYDRAIAQCAKVAQEDAAVAEKGMGATETALISLGKGIIQSVREVEATAHGGGKNVQEVLQLLRSTEKALHVEVLKNLQEIRQALHAKRRAINYFSVAFMGKTKAGKSTLHAVVTGEGWDAIGVGSQRTTRMNRVYEWKNIRIIDTPGIGAPGGKTDEEIAASIIDEADVICYVLTNDSQQETEFQFLKQLKAKSKPVILLLNVKQNITAGPRLQRFLENPEKVFEHDGASGLGGHIDRIRRYATQHYANSYFEIIPVQLLAAQLSRDPAHESNAEELYNASRLQDFLDSLRLSLISHGVMRRSQTFLGSTVGDIQQVGGWLERTHGDLSQLTESLTKSHQEAIGQVNRAARDSQAQMEQKIRSIYQDLRNRIPRFAEDNWDASESGLKTAWEKDAADFGLEGRLRQAIQEVGDEYSRSVRDILEEVGKEMQLLAQLSSSGLNMSEQDHSTLFRNMFKIGGGVIGVVGAIVALFNPVGWVIGIVGGFVNWLSGFFESKESKHRKAVQNISNSLMEQVQEQERAQLRPVQKLFEEQHQEIVKSIDAYFSSLLQGLGTIEKQFQDARSKVAGVPLQLNAAFAKRILDWAGESPSSIAPEAVKAAVSSVERDFGRHIRITTPRAFKPKRSLDEIRAVLQEDVSFQQAPPIKS